MFNDKKKYEKPNIEIIDFTCEDVIRTSCSPHQGCVTDGPEMNSDIDLV